MASAMASVATWNIAAINNNPFEYWVTYADAEYIDFMRGVEKLLGQDDRAVVEDGFTETMFRDLINELRGLEVGSLEEIERLWNEDISKRRMVQGFLKDKSIGDKRLASVPDRITNTIHLVDGSTLKRPTVINAFAGSALSSTELWWEAWKKFMFHTKVEISFGNCETKHQMVWSLIGPIPRSKYPAITPEEQAISVQLQILYLAILDAVFVFIANRVAPGRWEKVRQNLCEALIYNKDGRVCDILATSYKEKRIVFLQEASAAFVHKARNHRGLTDTFKIMLPTTFNGKRGQNSIILVSRAAFDISTAADVTDKVLGHIDGNFLEAGDLFALRIDDVGGQGYLLVSFHGDSNGLSTRPVLEGLHEAFIKSFSDLIFVAGIDSNTSSQASDKFHHGVRDFRALLEKQGMVSVWDKADDRMITTTCSARTSLQMQLNKAVSFKNRFSMANMSLKDWILAYGAQVEEITDADRDNTGERRYVGETMLPTTSFPSDHAIVSCRIRLAAVQAVGTSEGFSETDSVASTSDSCHKNEGLSGPNPLLGGGERTLYDYWGLVGDSGIRSLADVEFVLPPILPSDSLVDGSCPYSLGKAKGGHPLVEGSTCRFAYQDLKHYAESMVHESSVWVLFSARPQSTLLTKGWFQVLLAVLCILGLLDTVRTWSGASTYRGLYGSHFRLRLTRQGPSHPPDAASAHCDSSSSQACRRVNFTARQPALLMTSQKIQTCQLADLEEPGGTQAVFILPESSWVRGFSFTADGLESVESLQVGVEVSLDGETWSAVLPRPWAHFRYRAEHGNHQGRLVVEWTLVAGWQWYLDVCLCQAKLYLAYLCAAVLGRLGRGRWGTLVLSLNFFLNSIAFVSLIWSFSFGPAITTPCEGQSIHLLRSRVLVNLLLCIITLYEGFHMVDLGCLMAGTYTGVDAYYRLAAMYASPDPYTHSVGPATLRVIMTVVLLGGFAAMQICRMRVKSWISSELIKSDRAYFDKLWASVTSDDADVSALNRLCVLARQLCRSWDADQLRQIMGTGQQPVTSLDDLYASAALVDPLLQVQAEALAKEAGGRVSADQSSRGADSGPASPILEPACGSAPLKPWARSVEKVVRSYDGDPSRILDCCRRAIVLDRVADVLHCMESLISTEEIDVVRIGASGAGLKSLLRRCMPSLSLYDDGRNRLDLGRSVQDSAGFRNIVVNLRITSPKARELGVDHHICELQLTLRPFVGALSPESHRRYQILRNCRQDLARSSLVLPWTGGFGACAGLLGAYVGGARDLEADDW
eukprot:CAMPEP_0113730054 /NCGR_PEP_ID=MMETSP0038_2-20120614/42943_1 /TAXON_ID=2898 /ORGANISM="Cryptomonas paramecium" /LENGTH=1270 /DNA_ID=CAMNT_0000662067 /DNA_START=60 /DNA_END=3874 /DNA_ORIENTATION=- /assembly_acc=CAM_ASM_000170